ncbi:hypothetical protein HRI_004736800 [Hibiscus trionum]|uniref:Uncharacterized protein n=1 Tax=Hibiscus trionum TaxID=183268 RepID=A0A9W7MV95_HIBTR|nr:hypothetical protein HRI_004736800 [Hibiscus trionum]
MNELQKWAKMELRRMGVKDLSSALFTTEDIAEFENKKPESSKPKLKFKSSGGGDKDKATRNEGRQPWDRNNNSNGCYNCGGRHIARDYTQNARAAAIQEKNANEKKTHKMGAILSCMDSKKGNKKKGLMFVDITVTGQKLSALVDTGASELFISEQAAKKLGLCVEKASGFIKTVYSKEAPIAGIEK